MGPSYHFYGDKTSDTSDPVTINLPSLLGFRCIHFPSLLHMIPNIYNFFLFSFIFESKSNFIILFHLDRCACVRSSAAAVSNTSQTSCGCRLASVSLRNDVVYIPTNKNNKENIPSKPEDFMAMDYAVTLHT